MKPYYQNGRATIIEAVESGRRAIGIEYDKESVEIAIRRLSQENIF